MARVVVRGSSLGNALTELLDAEDIVPGDGQYYVYAYFRPNGDPCYIGKGRKRRWLEHEKMPNHYNRHFGSIIRNAGGSLPKMKLVEKLTNDQAIIIERGLIAAIGRHPNGPLVNLTDGGDGKYGYVTSAETKRRISIANNGRTHSLESRERQSRSTSGVPKTAAHNAAVSASLKGKPKSAVACAKMVLSSADRWSRDEEREKIRSYHRNMTDEQRALRSAKISAATKAAMADPAIRAKISVAARNR